MTAAAPRRGRPPVQHVARIRRLADLLPWLFRVGEASIDEVEVRFGIDRREVLALIYLAGRINPTGFPDDQVDVWSDGRTIHAFDRAGVFNRPLRLSPAEGFAVLAAGRTLLAVEQAKDVGGTAALESALAKLDAALQASGRLAVDIDVPGFQEEIGWAVDEAEAVDITYYSLYRDTLTERRIEPLRLFSDHGRWYVIARDHRSGDNRRRFRVDRIQSLTFTGEHFEPDPDVPTGGAFEEPPDVVHATVELPASARWVTETYDCLSVDELPGGSLRAVLRVVGDVWLERLLLRAGPEARVVDPPELSGLGPAAARRLLARYR